MLRILSALLSMAFGIVGTRAIGAEDFGGYVSVMAVAGLVSVALSMGLPTLIAREVASARGHGDHNRSKPLFDWSVLILFIIAALTIILGVGFGVQIALVLTYALIGNSASFLGAVHFGRERVLLGAWVTGIVQPGAALVGLVALSALVATGPVTAIVAQIFGATAALVVFVAALGQWALSAKRAKVWLTPAWSDRHWKFLRSGALLSGTQLLINSTTQIDILILTALADPNDVVHYYAAARAALVVSMFAGVNASFVEPQITRLYAAGNLKGAQSVVGDTALIGFGFSALAGLVAFALAPTYLSFYGSSFNSAELTLQVLILGFILLSLFGPGQAVLRATHQDGAVLKLTLASLIVNAAIAVLLVPHLGIVGAAIGTATQFVFYGGALAVMSIRTVNLRSDVLTARVWAGLFRNG